MLLAATLSVAWQPALRPHACRGAGSVFRSAAPHAGVFMQFGGGGGSKLPAEIEALLEPSVDRKATVPMWKAFRKVYGSDAAAIAAAEKNVIPILSFINTEENIKENWQVCMLQETLQPEREPKPKPEPEPNLKPNPNRQVLLEKFDREEASAWPSLKLS
jgi:hypothetical protein